MFRYRAVLLVLSVLLTISVAADDPLAGSGTAVLFGDRAAARQKIEAVLKTAREQKDASRQALALLMLGFSDLASSDGRAARTRFEESSAQFKATGNLFGQWLAVCALAEAESRESHYDEAVAAYALALDLLDEAARPEAKFSMAALLQMGEIFGAKTENPMGDFPVSEALLKPLLLQFYGAMTRTGYATVLLFQGNLQEAETQIERARAAAGPFFGAFDAPLAMSKAELHRRRLEFDAARAEYVKALRGPSIFNFLPGFESRQNPTHMDILSRLADLEILAGHLDAALEWNDEQLGLSRKSGQRDAEAWILGERGLLLYRARQYDAAMATFDRAMAAAEAAQSPTARASIYGSRAMLELTRGNYGASASGWQKSIELFRQGKEPIGETLALTMLSHVYAALDLHADAKEARDMAKKLAEQQGDRLGLVLADLAIALQSFYAGKASHAEAMVVLKRFVETPEAKRALFKQEGYDLLGRILGDPLGSALNANTLDLPIELQPLADSYVALIRARVLIDEGKNAEARVLLRSGLAKNPSGDLESGFHVLLGMAAAKEGKPQEALDELVIAAKKHEMHIEDLRVEELLAGYFGGIRRVYFDAVIERLVNDRRFSDALDFTERARSRTLLQQLGNARISPRRSADAALVREAEALRAMLDANALSAMSVPVARPSATAAEIQSKYSALLTRLKSSSAEYASLTTIEPLSLDEIRDELPPDTTLLSYFVTFRGVHTWLLDSEGLQHVRFEPGGDAVRIAECWAEQYIGRGRGAGPRDSEKRCVTRPTAEEAYSAIFAPVRSRIRTRRLMIVPHGRLHYVPFAALRNPDTNRLLLEDFSISYAPSASALRFLREKESSVTGSAMVIGEPGEDLLHAEEEVVRIASALGTVPILHDQAKESCLYELHGGPDLLHVAAHGEYNAEHPLFSRIALAPGNGRDGNLEVHEILGELDLTGVNLVVLAACETGKARGSGGDDLVGFTRALLYAGTPGVVATLWKIPDDAAKVLMEEFYCRLLAGESVIDALRFAQLATRTDVRLWDPLHWAAFGVYGLPQGRWNEQPQAESTRSPQPAQ